MARADGMTGDSALFAFESEVRLIGGAMYAPDACDQAFDRLRPEHFGDPIHGLIWGTIAAIVRGGGTPTPEIVRDRIGSHPGFREWGGFDQLWELWDHASTVGVPDHVAAVADRAGRRAMKAMLDELGPKIADTSTGDYAELLSQLEAGAAEIARSAVTADRWVGAGDMVRNAIRRAMERDGRIDFSFGIPELDAFIGGMNPGETTLLAARPGMGKSVGAQTIARASASRGRGTCFFSLEMSADALGLRLACDISHNRRAVHFGNDNPNATTDAAQKNSLSDAQWRRLLEAEDIVAGWPLMTDDRPGLSLQQIESAARRQHRAWERQGVPLGPVIIDHLGKVRPTNDRRGNKHAETADVSGGVAEMAKRLGVPVLALVQLNRQVEGRPDKTPGLSDLRQAGELEEDARQVIFLYRPEYYLRAPVDGETFEQEVERKAKLQDAARKLFWIVAKNSHGPLGQVLTYCDIGSSAIRSWDA